MKVRKTLREVCANVGVSRRVIQGYEEKGLVSAVGKNKYGHLLYDQSGEDKISLIRFYQQAGFSLREIAELMEMPNSQKKLVLHQKIQELKKESTNIERIIYEIEQHIAKLE